MSQVKKVMTELSNNINAAINEAIAHADKHGLSFSIEPSYGMGGTYVGDKDEWPEDEWDRDNFDGWYASSQGC